MRLRSCGLSFYDCFLEPVEYFIRDSFDFSAVSINNQVRHLPVPRVPLLHQRLQNLSGLTVFEKGPLTTPLRARQLLIDGRVKVDNKTARPKVIAILGVDDGASARGQYDPLSTGQLVDNPRFALTKPFLAFFFEDKGNVDAGTRLNLVVTVDEVEVQHSAELATDR